MKMTHLEKAKELVENFKDHTTAYLADAKGGYYVNEEQTHKDAKACALILCDEILDTMRSILGTGEFTTEYEARKLQYWNDVKTNLQNL